LALAAEVRLRLDGHDHAGGLNARLGAAEALIRRVAAVLALALALSLTLTLTLTLSLALTLALALSLSLSLSLSLTLALSLTLVLALSLSDGSAEAADTGDPDYDSYDVRPRASLKAVHSRSFHVTRFPELDAAYFDAPSVLPCPQSVAAHKTVAQIGAFRPPIWS
jgi:serine/threonine-protein kinase ATR